MANLKLQDEYNSLVSDMNNNRNAIIKYGITLSNSGNYKDFAIRFMFDVLKWLRNTAMICEWYEKYNCNDTHIESLLVKAFKEVNISTNEKEYIKMSRR